MSSTICANCSHELRGNYCSNCGQKADTHRLNWHFLWHDIQHGLFHFDKGVTYTLKQLFTRPGYAAKEFIEGKRVSHFKPISLVVLLGSIFAFLYHTSNIKFPGIVTKEGAKSMELLNWMFSHFSIIELMNIPLAAFAAWLAFRRYGYNFIEHFVINAFISAQRVTLNLVCFPILLIFSGKDQMIYFFAIAGIANFVFLFWTYRQVFRQLSLVRFYFRMQTMLIILAGLGILLSLLVGAITGTQLVNFH